MSQSTEFDWFLKSEAPFELAPCMGGRRWAVTCEDSVVQVFRLKREAVAWIPKVEGAREDYRTIRELDARAAEELRAHRRAARDRAAERAAAQLSFDF